MSSRLKFRKNQKVYFKTFPSFLFYFIYYLFLFFPFQVYAENSLDRIDWKKAKGFNVNLAISKQELSDLKKLGASIVRLSLPDSPILNSKAPYQTNDKVLREIDVFLGNAKDVGMSVILDPHTAPGFRNPYTTSPDDLFWTDQSFQRRYIEMWRMLAKRFSSAPNGTIVYDLLNEPVVPDFPDKTAAEFWNYFLREIISAIRSSDKTHTIMFEPARTVQIDGSYNTTIDSLSYLSTPSDPNIVVSVHFYYPQSLCLNGVNERYNKNLNYPGTIDGQFWNADKIKSTLLSAKRFSAKNNIPIFIGEFSASNIAGRLGNVYIEDLLNVLAYFEFGWAYHAFRENQLWDAEIEHGEFSKPRESGSIKMTSRMRLLTDNFLK